MLTADVEAGLRTRLRFDTPFYAAGCLKIIDKRGHVVPLEGNGEQLRFDAALEEQRESGRPMRAIVLKARQLGMSTWTQAKIFQRTTQMPNHKALTVAQDRTTAGALSGMAEFMYAHLPEEEWVKPPIRNARRMRELTFGESSAIERRSGKLGLNSSLLVDTANEFEAGRGFTYHDLHASECAFWPDLKRKLTGLLNTVPDEPDTLIVLESTANGHNHFKELWDQAENGDNDFVPFFAPWWQEPKYQRGFPSEEARRRFIDAIGTGPFGADEPHLVDVYELSPEQLNWRRWAIINRAQGDIRNFKQEFPASASEAFLSTGRQVFASMYVGELVERTKLTAPDRVGELKVASEVVRRMRSGAVKVPTEAAWRDRPQLHPEDPLWLEWDEPQAGQHYVLAVDPAKGGSGDDDEGARHAIEIIDHTSKVQVAEWCGRIDPDLVAVQIMLAALRWNRPWVAIETTGGWGLSMARRVHKDFGYPKVYMRKSLETRREHQDDRLGWDTNRVSKQILEDGAKELLRERQTGIKSVELSREMSWYVRDAKNHTGPESGKHSDRLMAWMIAQQVAMEKPIPTGRAATSTVRWRSNPNPVTKY